MSLLRTNEMNVRVQPPSRYDQPLTGDDLRGDADDHALGHSGHHIRVARFADARDQAVFYAQVGLVNAGVIHHQRVGDHAIQRIRVPHARRLPHAFADDFATAKFAFVAIAGEIFLHFQKQ